MVLICHDHDMPIAKGSCVGVLLAKLEAKDLADVVDFLLLPPQGVTSGAQRTLLSSATHLVVANLVMRCGSNVEQLSLQWEHTETITSNDREPRNGKGLGRVTFSEDQSALVRTA